MKKALKIIGITAAIIFGLLILIPFAFQGQIKDMVKGVINDNLNAKVEFSNINLSFLRNFPKASVSVSDLAITNYAPFKDETFMTAKNIALTMSIGELFKSSDDPVVVNTITVDEVLLTLKTDKFGNNNYDITKEDESSSTSNNSKPFALDIEDYSISNSALIYNDEIGEILVQMTEFNHEGHANFTTETSEFDTHSDVNISFSLGGTNYLNNNPIKLDAIFGLDLANNKYIFKENKGYINELPLQFNGYVQQLENGQDIDISFENPESDFKNFLALIPKQYSKEIEDVKTTGDFKVKGLIQGLSSDNTIPKLDISIVSNNASFKYPDLPKTVRDIVINTSIKNTTGNPDDTYVNIETLNFKIDDDVFTSSATLKNITDNILVDAKINGILNLANISKVYPLDIEEDLSGILKASIATSFDMNALDTNAFDRIKSDGSISLSKFTVSTESLKNPLEISQANITLTTNKVSLNTFNAKTGTSDLNATGTLNNFLGFLLRDQTLKGNFNLNSTMFKVQDFISDETVLTNETNDKTTVTSNKIPVFLDCTINANAKTVVYDNLNLKNVTGALIIKDQSATLQNLSSDIFDGSLGLNGSISTKTDTPIFMVDLDIKRFDIAKSFEGLELLQNLAPIAKLLQGKLNTSISLSGNLDKELSPDLNSVSGEALAEILTAHFDTTQTPLLNKLDGALSFVDFDAIDIKDLKTKLEFADGQVAVKPFDLKYKDIDIEISGAHGFDKTINYNAVFDVPAKYLGSDINRLIGNIDDNEVNAITIPVSANISGSYTNPNVETDLTSAVSNLTKQLVEIQKQKLLNEGKEKVNDLIGSVIGGNKTKTDSLKKEQSSAIENVIDDIIKTKTPNDTLKNNNSSDTQKVIKNVLGGLLGTKPKDSVE